MPPKHNEERNVIRILSVFFCPTALHEIQKTFFMALFNILTGKKNKYMWQSHSFSMYNSIMMTGFAERFLA